MKLISMQDFVLEQYSFDEQLYRDNANIEGIESSLSDQYMAVMAAYGIIMFFRDNILADE